MLEILGSSLPFSYVCKQIGEVNASSEMLAIYSEALLIVKHSFLIFLGFLMNTPKVEEDLSSRWFT